MQPPPSRANMQPDSRGRASRLIRELVNAGLGDSEIGDILQSSEVHIEDRRLQGTRVQEQVERPKRAVEEELHQTSTELSARTVLPEPSPDLYFPDLPINRNRFFEAARDVCPSLEPPMRQVGQRQQRPKERLPGPNYL
jgi:hypothetical protein